MKHVLVVLSVTIAAFVIGCQDSNMTGPVGSSTHQLHKASPNTGSAIVKGDVAPSTPGVEEGIIFHVDGQVAYEYHLVGEETDPILEFSIVTQASLMPNKPIVPLGTIDDQSIYQISLASKQGVIFVQRDYNIESLRTKFHVLFAIAEDNSFSVESMWMDQLGVDTGAAKTN